MSVEISKCGRPFPKKKVTETSARELLKMLLAKLNTYVESQGLNRSETREKILETVVYEARHFRAGDLLKRLQVRHADVGKATLYRNLPILVESGVIQEGPADSEGQTFYEVADSEHHDHIVCLDCRRIFEFHDSKIESQQARVIQDLDFVPQSHRHVIYAKCKYLNKRKTTGK